ncbi:hypothetical protein I302_107391 [Kwoniella bestiolae CBS 10118]|uniref:WEE/WEE-UNCLASSIFIED protein kinase n=1 Tax=Kwoniella bestiolae CBS 10118 TaxID=1296100 RepID=A0A1B9FYP6_9TREE|nr:WEE/WEE-UNCLASSIFIED protein kinase [Kwoniella bestiolae CBS 10118]OCF23885.1 WEE/WEE-UNCLASSIFIED protein kinase [Kwoniella bestiolae CBS 10118]
MLATPMAPPHSMASSSQTPPPQQQTSSYHSSRPSTSSLPRSYKRAKSTPSPQSPIFPNQTISSGSGGLPGPSRAKARATVARRLVDASPQTQPWRLDGGRRREMSVPLLSQELSHFSLSHSPPEMCQEGDAVTPPISTRPFLTSPAQRSHTPRSRSHVGQSKTPFAAALPKDHTYPSTAPLPPISSFLGSPFSTKTARGRYMYQNASPSQNANKATMTERIGVGRESFDEPGLEWLETNEGLPSQPRRGSREGKMPLVEGLPKPPSGRLRRGTNGSTSSMDELSGSGASTASLLSLARNSMEHHSRPNIITVWDEQSQCLEEEEEESSTPSRQLFAKPDDYLPLQMSSKINKPSFHNPKKPTTRPSLPRSSGGQLLQSYTITNSPVPKPSEDKNATISPEKTGKSPLSTFLPRLLSSRKVSLQSLRRKSPVVETGDDEDMMTDTEDGSSLKGSLRGKSKNLWSRTRSITSSRNAMEGGDHEPSLGVGIGLGIRKGPIGSVVRGSTAKSIDLARSLSSDSSGDIETSPSRPLSNRGSTSLFVNPSSPLSPSTTTSLNKAPSRSAFLARRKSVNGQTSGTPGIIANGPRPAKARPLLRRGITAPADSPYSSSSLLSADAAFHTPTHILFGDVKPSPAAFASTGLVKKKSGIQGGEIPKFGGTDSEPVGEIKREQAAAQHGLSRTIEPPSPVSPIESISRTRPSLNTSFTSTTTTSTSTITSGNTVSTNSSNAAYIQAAQKTRGLRRKGSQMFTASGSIGSIDMMRSDSNRSARGGTSPATPTKPGLQLTPIGLGVTTPSPTGHHLMYPFASSSVVLSTPPHSSVYAPSDPVEPSSIKKFRNMPARVRQISNSHVNERGPLARSSNPMLAASYKTSASMHTVPETPGQGQIPSINIFNSSYKPNKRGSASRLEKDFTVVQTLGSGAFSQVLKVREKSTGHLYAVKAGKPYTGAKNRLRQLEEVSILRQLSLIPHENVVEYIDSWETHSRLYIRTRLSECGDLSRFLGLLGDFGGLGEERVWKSLIELSSGLRHIHKNNFLHLDLKSSNILINHDGGLVIADLGMAVICSNDNKGNILQGLSPALPERDDQGGFTWSMSTSTTPEDEEKSRLDIIPSPIIDREFEGDREYLCPEALNENNGKYEIGKGSDIFSLGMVVLESAVNVVLPSNGEGWIKLRNDDFSDLEEHYRLSPSQRSTSNSDFGMEDPSIPMLSQDLIGVIKGMMRSDPAERWDLEDIWNNRVVKNVMATKKGRALVEEGEGWLEGVLRE